jgi:hypothetical protein
MRHDTGEKADGDLLVGTASTLGTAGGTFASAMGLVEGAGLEGAGVLGAAGAGNRSAMDWGASWGTDYDHWAGSAAGLGGIAGGIGGSLQGLASMFTPDFWG